MDIYFSLQLSYADTHPMYTSESYPNFYRVVPSESAFNPARLKLIQHFNWTRVGTFYQNAPRYSLVRIKNLFSWYFFSFLLPRYFFSFSYIFSFPLFPSFLRNNSSSLPPLARLEHIRTYPVSSSFSHFFRCHFSVLMIDRMKLMIAMRE